MRSNQKGGEGHRHTLECPSPVGGQCWEAIFTHPVPHDLRQIQQLFQISFLKEKWAINLTSVSLVGVKRIKQNELTPVPVEVIGLTFGVCYGPQCVPSKCIC